jgi:hypothetical protein
VVKLVATLPLVQSSVVISWHDWQRKGVLAFEDVKKEVFFGGT